MLSQIAKGKGYDLWHIFRKNYCYRVSVFSEVVMGVWGASHTQSHITHVFLYAHIYTVFSLCPPPPPPPHTHLKFFSYVTDIVGEILFPYPGIPEIKKHSQIISLNWKYVPSHPPSPTTFMAASPWNRMNASLYFALRYRFPTLRRERRCYWVASGNIKINWSFYCFPVLFLFIYRLCGLALCPEGHLINALDLACIEVNYPNLEDIQW